MLGTPNEAKGTTMQVQINTEVHKVVVVIEGSTFGFLKLSDAIAFVELQYISEDDKSKVFTAIATALSDDKEDDLQIYAIEEYADLFMDADEDDE